MTTYASFSISKMRPLLVAVLAFLMLTITSAQIRETVLVKMQENGVQRFYETEVHNDQRADILSARLKMGRKPVEEQILEATRSAWPPECPIVGRHAAPASARAPPHQPRGPPTA